MPSGSFRCFVAGRRNWSSTSSILTTYITLSHINSRAHIVVSSHGRLIVRLSSKVCARLTANVEPYASTSHSAQVDIYINGTGGWHIYTLRAARVLRCLLQGKMRTCVRDMVRGLCVCVFGIRVVEFAMNCAPRADFRIECARELFVRIRELFHAHLAGARR